MLRSIIRKLSRLLLGNAARAGEVGRDAENELVLAPRALLRAGAGTMLPPPDAPSCRRVGHLVVHEGGLSGRARHIAPAGGSGPGPRPVAQGGFGPGRQARRNH